MTGEEALNRYDRIRYNLLNSDDKAAVDVAFEALREQESAKNAHYNCCKKTNSSWISVEDRLPKEWKEKGGDLINYLVFMPEYGVDVGNYAKPVKTWLCMGIPCKVTHWMPLPEPPEVEV